MQKRLLFIACLLLAIGNKIVAANEADLITISDFSMYPGDTKEVSVVLTNTDTYVGFQFDLYLPTGVTVESYNGSSRIPDGTTLEMAQQTNGGYRFIAAGLGGNAITGNDGAVMTLTLKSSESIASNAYSAYLRNVKISKADGSGVVIAEQPFTVTIAEWPKVADVQFTQDGNVVTLSTTTANAKIFYTLSNNDNGEQEYTAPLTMTGDCTIEAYATRDGYLNSDTTSFVFHAGGVTCSNPVIARTEGTNVVTATTTTEGATIYYTTDGSEPSEVSSVFPTNGLTVSCNQTIKAIALRDSYYPSQVTTFEVDWFQCEQPTFSWNGDALTITSTTVGENNSNAAIYYTMIETSAAGTVVPDTMLYNGPITVTSDVTITAIARLDGFNDSQQATLVYPYTAWKSLTDAISNAQTVYTQSANNSHVSADQRSNLQTLTTQAETLYAERIADVDAINNMTTQLTTTTSDIEVLLEIKDAYAALSDGNTVMTFYYDNQKDARGGMGVGPFNGNSDQSWSDARESITTVVFDDSFASYTTLTSTAYWFYNCKNLQVITGLDKLNTANVTNMGAMFQNIEGLTSLDLSNFNTANVTNMTGMFYGCPNLTSLDVSSFNTANVTNMNYMFGGCSGLTSLDLSSFNTASVTNMNYMFYKCSGLTSLDLSGFNTANVTTMNSMFLGCSELNTIYAGSEWSTEAVTNGENMFNNCTSLVGGRGTAYDADHTDHAYARIDMAPDAPGYFSDKNAPTEYSIKVSVVGNGTVTIDSITVASGTDGQIIIPAGGNLQMFLNPAAGSKIESLMLDGENNNDSIVAATETAAASYTLWKIYDEHNIVVTFVSKDVEAYAALSENNTKLTFYYDTMKEDRSGMGVGPFNGNSDQSWSDARESITTVVFDDSFASYTTLTSTAYWFYNCKNLQVITGLDKLNTANVTNMGAMFQNIEGLTSLDLSNFNTANVTNMTGMFYGCPNLTSLDVSSFNTANVTNMNYMFGGCSGLTSLDLSSFNTASVTNMNYMFYKCSGLTSLDLSGFNTANVTTMNSMFLGCSELNTIYAGSEWSTGAITNGENMFNNCTSLVGGQGTAYDADHTDYTYAHLDEGTQNPGYLTPMDGYGKVAKPTFTHEGNLVFVNSATEGATIRYTIDDEAPTDMTGIIYSDGISVTRNCTIRAIAVKENFTPSEVAEYNVNWFKVEMPTIAWVGDQLIATTTTEGAVVQYTLTQSGVETPLDQGGESSPLKITVTQDAIITLYATKQDWTNSDTLVIDYLYTLWQRLVTAIDDATNTANRGENNQKVDPQMVHQLREMIQDAQGMYSERTEERSRIEWMIDELSMMIAEINVQMSSADFAYDGQTLTVSGNTTLTAAVETAGGKARVSKTITAIFWESTQTITGDSLKLMNITNPNLLLYVNTADQAPADVQNVIVGDVAKLIVLTDADTLTNGNFNCPRPFVAQRITYTRNFQQRTQTGVSRGWETLALPFNVQVIYKEDGTELVPFAANSQDDRTRPFWLKNISGGELTDADAIEANKPYLLSLPNDPTVYPADYCLSGNVRFISENVTVPETNPETNYLGENDIALVPTFSLVPFATDVYALNVGMERENHAEGSIFESGLRSVRPFECYSVHLNASGPAPAFMSVADLMNGGLTDIDTVKRDYDSNDNDDWYTLDGRKLQTRPTTKGLYIHQGRKVVVK